MMIGPVVLAAVAIGFAWIVFWPREKVWGLSEIAAAVMVWICSSGFGLLACLFFIIGLRRVLLGGAWGCVIDREYLTWSYPNRMSFHDQSVALRDVRRVEIVAPPGDGDTDGDFKEFIVTDTEKLAIHTDCFGRLVPFLRALLRANPAIDVEIVEPGKTKLWRATRRQIEALCDEARMWRITTNRGAS